MRRVSAIISISLVCASCAYRAPQEMIARSKVAVSMCLKSIENFSHASLPDAIDHIYVDAFDGGYGLAFSHGEAGSFGKTSLDYHSDWSCGVSAGEVRLLISRLVAVKDDGQFPEASYTQSLNKKTVTSILFLKKKDDLRYCCSQRAALANFEKHNPSSHSDRRNGMVQ